MTRYIARVVIDGFQSHEHTELNFGPGVVALTGPSDNGKSAVLRAIRWCLWNIAPGDGNWIRKGCARAAAEVTMSDGTVILRENNKGRNKYVVSVPGEPELPLVDFGRGVPKEVLKAHGMLPVKPDPDKPSFLLNFASQLDAPFFLSDGPTARAKIIGRLAGINVLDTASARAADDIRANNTTIKRLETDLTRVLDQLKPFDGLDAEEQRLQQVEQILQRVPGVIERRRALDGLRTRMTAIREAESRADAVLRRTGYVDEVTALIHRIGQVSQLRVQLANTADGMQAIRDGLETAEAVITRTGYVDKAIPLILQAEAGQARRQTLNLLRVRSQTISRGLDTAERTIQRHAHLDELARLVSEAQKRRDRLNKLYPIRQIRTRVVTGWNQSAATLERLKWVPQAVDQIEKATAIQQQLQRIKPHAATLRRLRADIATSEQRLAVMEKRAPIAGMVTQVTDDVQQRKALATLLARMNGLQQQMTVTDQTIASAGQRLSEHTAAYAEALQEAGVCPTCLQPVTETATARIIGGLSHEEVHAHVG